jgi:DNA (cytosine-5)-methyltransferase 1
MEIWSFFTGAMGLDLGLEKAGLKPTLGIEIDPVFCGTIRRNRPALSLIEGDVAELTLGELNRARGFRKKRPDVFLMIGGPPCQSFSSGGKVPSAMW